jgi:uncharacterized protein YndB with AHSA1/START domain
MTEFVVRAVVAAKPETVFDVFTDHRGYARLVGLIRSSELEREGDPAPNGAGAIRKLHLPGATVREQMTEYTRPERYSYTMLSGAPVRDYLSTVTFTPTRQGTAVAYSVTEIPSIAIIGPVIDQVVRLLIRTITRKAAAQAERNASAGHLGRRTEDLG